MKMKKILLLCMTSLLCGSLSAGTIPQKKEIKLTPEATARKRQFIERTGGLVDLPGSGPKILVLDSSGVPEGVYKRFDLVFSTSYRLPFSMEKFSVKNANAPFAEIFSIRKEKKALMVISLVNQGSFQPMLSVYPENRVAIVNVDKLRSDDSSKYETRLIKEIWRAIGFSLGVGYASNDADVMQPIGSTIELDAIEWQVIQPMNFMRAQKVLTKYGVKRGRRTTYLKACEMGVAPMPRNEIRRKIWNKFNSSAKR